MVDSIIKEIEIRSKATTENDKTDIGIISPEEKIETIYFGGGTPSLLSKDEIFSIIFSIRKNFIVENDAEITFEANPDDINPDNLDDWKMAGINRLSIGVQSFIERDLKWMNRAHNTKQALDSIKLSKNAGFKNFSIDLIFGTPGLSDEEWGQNIKTIIDLEVPHISAYALTVEPKTALHKMISLKRKENINSDVQAKQFLILMKMLRDAGYEHYEISNFAKPGFRSRHNSSYWQGKKYIGIGPSAHSYNGKGRMWNTVNNVFYIKSLKENIIPFEKEMLTDKEKTEEYIMTSLRTIEGLDLDFVENNFSNAERERIENILETKIEKENFFQQNEKIILTDKGKLFADAIAVELFV